MTRELKICKELIRVLNLDLKGLTVLTECASGPYLFLPITAALAGAQVIAAGVDSRFGSFEANRDDLLRITQDLSMHGRVNAVPKSALYTMDLANVNIVTNSGGLRPIDRPLIELFSKNCVLPLMWEPWEFRKQDLDIKACQEKEVIVLGTNEQNHLINNLNYTQFLALKLMFDLGNEINNNLIVLLGGGKLGELTFNALTALGLEVWWYGSNHKASKPYERLPEILTSSRNADVILNVEHHNASRILGKDGIVSFARIAESLNCIMYGHLAGNVDEQELKESGIKYLPQPLLPFGYFSYDSTKLGPRPALELNALGLKVGEILARARLSGKSIEDSIKTAEISGFGMDFENGFMNYIP